MPDVTSTIADQELSTMGRLRIEGARWTAQNIATADTFTTQVQRPEFVFYNHQTDQGGALGADNISVDQTRTVTFSLITAASVGNFVLVVGF